MEAAGRSNGIAVGCRRVELCARRRCCGRGRPRAADELIYGQLVRRHRRRDARGREGKRQDNWLGEAGAGRRNRERGAGHETRIGRNRRRRRDDNGCLAFNAPFGMANDTAEPCATITVPVGVATPPSSTTTLTLPERPSADAVIATLPGAIARTSPVVDTDALFGSLDVQTTERGASVWLVSPRNAAVSCDVAPGTSVTALGETEMPESGVGPLKS